ncbi:MAG: hypothetical protein VX278_01895 [Myxococcota bacterium]|nr:hypothetical protein [Myxococcota bacterium]
MFIVFTSLLGCLEIESQTLRIRLPSQWDESQGIATGTEFEASIQSNELELNLVPEDPEQLQEIGENRFVAQREGHTRILAIDDMGNVHAEQTIEIVRPVSIRLGMPSAQNRNSMMLYSNSQVHLPIQMYDSHGRSVFHNDSLTLEIHQNTGFEHRIEDQVIQLSGGESGASIFQIHGRDIASDLYFIDLVAEPSIRSLLVKTSQIDQDWTNVTAHLTLDNGRTLYGYPVSFESEAPIRQISHQEIAIQLSESGPVPLRISAQDQVEVVIFED